MDLALGNVLDLPLEEIWNGPQMRTIRQHVWEEQIPDCCQGCYHMPA